MKFMIDKVALRQRFLRALHVSPASYSSCGPFSDVLAGAGTIGVSAVAVPQDSISSRPKTKIKKFWEEVIAYSPLIRHGPHRKRRVQLFYYCMCIRCCCNVLTEQLPSNDRGHTDWWEGFMKYAVEMGSGAMILSRVRVTVDGVLNWILDLLTNLPHNS
jgi:hypothetical protein